MRVQSIKIYKFEELSKEAQDVAIAAERSINIEYDWYEPIIEYWQEKLAELGFEDMGVKFRLYNSQGDGACFGGGSINNSKVLNTLLCSDPTFIRVLDLVDYFELDLHRLNSRYSHENCHRVDLIKIINRYEGISDKLITLLFQFSDAVEALRKSLCVKIYRELSTEYDHLSSEEAIRQALVDNELEFTADGVRWRD